MKNSKFNTLFKTIMEDVYSYDIPNQLDGQTLTVNTEFPEKPVQDNSPVITDKDTDDLMHPKQIEGSLKLNPDIWSNLDYIIYQCLTNRKVPFITFIIEKNQHTNIVPEELEQLIDIARGYNEAAFLELEHALNDKSVTALDVIYYTLEDMSLPDSQSGIEFIKKFTDNLSKYQEQKLLKLPGANSNYITAIQFAALHVCNLISELVQSGKY